MVIQGETTILDLDKYYRTGFFKPRMWAQYGENHRGICIVVSRDALANSIKNEYKNFGFYRGEIKYNDSFMKTRKAYHVDITDQGSMDFRSYFIKEHLIKFREELFFTKTSDWRDENEYRFLLLTDNEKSEYFVDIRNSIRAIFVGIDFPKVYMETVRRLAKKFDADVFELEINDGIPRVFP